jgi:hypothetical protein
MLLSSWQKPADGESFCDDLSLQQENMCKKPGNQTTQLNTHIADVSGPVQCRPYAVAVPTNGEAGCKAQVKYHDRFVVELTTEEMAVIKAAFNKARKESRKKDRASLLVHMARTFLEGSSLNKAGKKRTKAPYQVVYHHHLPSGLSWCATEKGERPVARDELEKALCDAEIRDADESPENDTISQNEAISHEVTGEADPLRDVNQSPVDTASMGMLITRLHSTVPGRSEIPIEDISVKPVEYQQAGIEYANELYGKMKQAKPRNFPGSTHTRRRARRTIPPHIRKRVLDHDCHCCPPAGAGRRQGVGVRCTQ